MTDSTPLLLASLAIVGTTFVVLVWQVVRSRKGGSGKPEDLPWWGPRWGQNDQQNPPTPPPTTPPQDPQDPLEPPAWPPR